MSEAWGNKINCDCLEAKMKKQGAAIKAAMNELENYPNIGKNGPRLSELKRVEKQGHVWWEATYHDMQKAWRLLEDGLKNKRSDT